MKNADDIDKAISKKEYQIFANLYGRWLDERKYEDFKEYEEVIKKVFSKFGKIVKISKSPFSVIIEAENKDLVRILGKGKSVSIGINRFVKK
jgi:hypothetical protein